ncbi:MAG: Ig-like domain-containing protein [Saprospiraceae bacterium]
MIQKHNVLVCYAVILFSLLYSGKGFANVYTPNTFSDPVITTLNNSTGAINGGATISLRSSLIAANNLGGVHTINLPAGTYDLTLGMITLNDKVENITITGAGAATTIINMVANAAQDRMLLIGVTGAFDNMITSFTGLTFQGGLEKSDTYGGGAIIAGGGPNCSLTLTNCIFQNNAISATATATGGGSCGGAVRYNGGGSLIINNCQFINNTTPTGEGGGVSYFLENLASAGNGVCTITNSTFTGNSTTGVSVGDGGALGIAAQGRLFAGVTMAVTVNSNTFTGNSATGTTNGGGAIYLTNSFDVGNVWQVHYNRIVGNSTTAPDGSTGLAQSGGSQGSVDAINNWWGCNTGPIVGSPCNKAVKGVGGGTQDVSKWLQLKTTASPSPICNTPAGFGNTSVVTTSFLSNSASDAIPVGNLTRLIGLPVTWGPTTLGSLSAQQGTIQASGTATATFTSNGTGGTATINTQVDNVPTGETSPARASIIVNTAPIVTLQPISQTKCDPSSVTFTSTASGSPAPTVQWQVSTNGGMSFGNIAGATNTTLTFTAVYADNAKQYRAAFTNFCNTVNSNPAILTVNPIEYPEFLYTRNAYCQMGTEDPLPNIYGTPGGVFSATAGLSINTTSGQIDVSASSVGGPYTITYNTNGPCPKMATYAVSIVNCIPSATLTDVIIIDNGISGKADPNDRIRLTATIGNSQTADYKNLQLVTNNDPRVTFVAGSFKSTPVAVNDLYATTLNTMLNVLVGSGVIVNDFDDNIPGLSVTAHTNPAQGTLVINANGSFTYTPNNGFTGNDTFTYTITDSDAQTNTGTVKIHIQ